jgi:hypothetical protein
MAEGPAVEADNGRAGGLRKLMVTVDDAGGGQARKLADDLFAVLPAHLNGSPR